MSIARRGQPPHPGTAGDPTGLAAESGVLGRALRDSAAGRATGVLCVFGEPGGTIHLADGRVVAIDTPGSPGAEVILVRSGRVPEPGWAAAFTAAAADGLMGAELVRRGFVGTGELESVLRTVLADGMFALTSGQVDECRTEQVTTPCLLPLDPPAEPDWLLAETSRRLRVLASMPNPIRHDRDRVARSRTPPAAGATLNVREEEILALANGRRTARDMAFVLGCGVYALTLELGRMHESGLLVIGSRRGGGLPPPGRYGAPADPARSPADVPADGDRGDGDGTLPALPRRRRANPAPPSRAQPAIAEHGSTSALLRLLRPGSAHDQ